MLMGINGRTARVLGTAALGLAVALAAHGQTQEALQTRVEALEKELQALKQQLGAGKSGEKAQSPPLVVVGANGFAMRSADSNFVLRVRATIQGDARFYPGGGSGTANDTFLMLRVRPVFEGTVLERFDYRLMLDFGSGLTSTP